MGESWETPVPTEGTREFWEGTTEETLLIPYCNDCEEYFFFPRTHCPTCMTENIDHRESTGRGTLVTYTTVHRPPIASLQEKAPYINALVDLEEGVRMMANIEADSEEALESGMPLEITWAETETDRKLPNFEPTQNNEV